MLDACLHSLANQTIPSDVEAQIVVIDNETEPNNREAVQAFALTCALPVHYVHEPRRGIAKARNAALNKALELEADWIAMLDDDETAAPDWLAELMKPELRHVPIVSGTQVYLFPETNVPFWYVKREKRRKARSAKALKFAYTNNVRFSTTLLCNGLRFNEALGLMGGEDPEFFFTAHRAGAAIAKNDRAVTFEAVHPERLTYRGQIGRAYWFAAGELRQMAIERTWKYVIWAKAHTIPVNIIFGGLELAISPLFIAFGPSIFKRRALSGGRKIAKAAGRAAAILGRMPEPYRVTVGQ